MTIYTSKGGDKKEEEKIFPQVVTDVLPEKENLRNEEALLPPLPPTLVRVSGPKKRSQCCNVCVLVIVLFLLITGVFGGIYLYKHLAHRKFRGYCGVRYYEYQEDTYEPESYGLHGSKRGHHRGRNHHKRMGHFEEQIEIDTTDWKFEKIEVPDVEDARRATVLHDFEKNITAIVDKDYRRCFVIPLNRSDVIPPKDFWDLVSKIGNGYYLPDVEVIREEYRVVQPPIQNLANLGVYVWHECRRFDTYKLQKHNPGDPIAMVKRSASEDMTVAVAGKTGLHLMTIKGQ